MLGKERREWMYLPRLSHSPDRLTLSPSLSLTPKFSLHLASLCSPPVSPFLTHTHRKENSFLRLWEGLFHIYKLLQQP